jgi:hypothetical protein
MTLERSGKVNKNTQAVESRECGFGRDMQQKYGGMAEQPSVIGSSFA